MNKEFVPYEESLALKELGYEEETLHFFLYREDGSIPKIPTYSAKHMFGASWNKYPSGLRIAAPLWQQAFRWFREKYQYEVSIHKLIEEDGHQASIYWEGTEEIAYQVGGKDYDDAQLNCLQQLIKIVKDGKD